MCGVCSLMLDLFSALVSGLADPFRRSVIPKVVGIEARGFILGGAVAAVLRSGFVAIRKEGGLLPGAKLVRSSPPDYRRRTSQLRLQRESLTEADRVLLVDAARTLPARRVDRPRPFSACVLSVDVLVLVGLVRARVERQVERV